MAIDGAGNWASDDAFGKEVPEDAGGKAAGAAVLSMAAPPDRLSCG